jgi:hypothetical protein
LLRLVALGLMRLMELLLLLLVVVDRHASVPGLILVTKEMLFALLLLMLSLGIRCRVLLRLLPPLALMKPGMPSGQTRGRTRGWAAVRRGSPEEGGWRSACSQPWFGWRMVRGRDGVTFVRAVGVARHRATPKADTEEDHAIPAVGTRGKAPWGRAVGGRGGLPGRDWRARARYSRSGL